MLSKEEKLKDPYYIRFKNVSNEVFNRLKPLILEDEELLTYFKYSLLNNIDDEEGDKTKDLLTYYKYRLAEYTLGFKKNDNTDLNNYLEDYVKTHLTNGFLNKVVWHFNNMENLEADSLLYEVFKDLYLMEKYKGTPFSEGLVNFYKGIIRYEDIKPKRIIPSSEVNDENKEEVLEAIKYYEASIRYNNIIKALYGHLDGLEYNEKVQIENVEKYLVDEFYLYNYNFILESDRLYNEQHGNNTESNPLEPLKVHLKRTSKDAEDYFKLREDIKENREKLAKEYGIDLHLDKDDIDYIKNKKREVLKYLGTYNYSYLDFINWNSLTYLLGLSEELQEALHDPNTDKSFKSIIEKKKKKEKPTPHIASKEDIAKEQKDKTHYNTGSTPSNKMILDTYGAYSGIENNDLDKIKLKIQELNKKIDSKKIKEDLKKGYRSELKVLLKKQEDLEQQLKDLLDEKTTKEQEIDKARQEYFKKTQEQQLSKTDKQQYERLIDNLATDLKEVNYEIETFNKRGVVFRGNLFNELEYTDDKGKTLTTLRDKDGNVLNPKDIPTLAEAFLRVANDLYINKLDNYNEFINKIDDLWPKSKGANYRLANETIKKGLGKDGFILDVNKLLQYLQVSDENLTYYSNCIEDAIKFYNNIEISIQQKDDKFNNSDFLNIFFGITNNVKISSQIKGNRYIYFEISRPYQVILDNTNSYKTPMGLLKYATGQLGNKRIYKLGDHIFYLIRVSLNGGVNGVKIDENGRYYIKRKISSLIKVLKDSGLLTEPRPRKYREDVFNKLVAILDTLESDPDIPLAYEFLYDDSVPMSNDTFKYTFENSFIKLYITDLTDDYENILAKNLRSRKDRKIPNANKFILTWGKYEGKTLKEVLEIDKAYLEWILKSDIKIPKPKITRNHIKNLLENEKNKEQLKK